MAGDTKCGSPLAIFCIPIHFVAAPLAIFCIPTHFVGDTLSGATPGSYIFEWISTTFYIKVTEIGLFYVNLYASILKTSRVQAQRSTPCFIPNPR